MKFDTKMLVLKYRKRQQKKSKGSKKWLVLIQVLHFLEELLQLLLLLGKFIKQMSDFF